MAFAVIFLQLAQDREQPEDYGLHPDDATRIERMLQEGRTEDTVTIPLGSSAKQIRVQVAPPPIRIVHSVKILEVPIGWATALIIPAVLLI